MVFKIWACHTKIRNFNKVWRAKHSLYEGYLNDKQAKTIVSNMQAASASL